MVVVLKPGLIRTLFFGGWRTPSALNPRTPVRNLYLTGADAAVLGVVGALAGGALAASAVLRRNVMAAK